MNRQTSLVCTAALLLAVAACDQSTGPSTGISQATAAQLAADMDAQSTLGATDFGLGASFSIGVATAGSTASVAGPIPTRSFTVTRQCPKGGTVDIVGSTSGTADPATHSLSLTTTATRTDKACAFQTRDGVLTINGNPNLVFTGNLNIVNGALSGIQKQTHTGGFTWARTSGSPLSGECTVNLTSEFDPAAHSVHVFGQFCGHNVDVTRTRGS